MAIDRRALSESLSEDLLPYVEAKECLSLSQQRAASVLLGDFLSKDRDDPSDGIEAAALQDFLRSNDRCKAWTLHCETDEDRELIGAFRQEINRFFFRGEQYWLPSLYDCLDYGNVGSGSSQQGKDTAFYAKFFSSVLTHGNPLLVDIYKRWIEKLPLWSRAEQIRELECGEPRLVTSCRLEYADKNRTTKRTIAVEATLNSFMQLGLAYLMNERMYIRWGYDPALAPEINRKLAQIGSLYDTISTIDCKGASNSVGMTMCQSNLPKGFFDLLCQLRMGYIDIPGESEPVELHMLSSMGNGYTFPLETMLFSWVVHAVYRHLGIPIVNSQVKLRERLGPLVGTKWVELEETDLPNWSVFGDDIIVVKSATHLVMRLLSLLGFEVNTGKTFVEGPFRESCGEDFYQGVNVRGVYLKTTKNMANVYALINNLNHWSARTRIPLPRTIQYLVGQVCPRPVPLCENKEAGIQMPYRLAVEFVDKLVTEGKLPRKVLLNLTRYKSYQCLRPVADSYQLGDRIIEMRPERGRKRKTLVWNPEGLLTAILHGGVADNKITVRTKTPRYRPTRVTVPQWDFHIPSTLSWTDNVTRQHLDSAIDYNLTL